MKKCLGITLLLLSATMLSATTLREVDKICALCQTRSTQTEVTSTNRMGYPDLDLRPPEMMRSTIEYWVQECPACGYCSEDIAAAGEGAETTIKTDAYRARLNDPDLPRLANRFLCLNLVREAAGKKNGAVYAAMCAAWACDDANNVAGACDARRLAIQEIKTIKDGGNSYMKQTGGDELLLADLARRCGDFEEARNWTEQGLGLNTEELVHKLLLYEKELATAKDPAAHTIEKAVGEQERK